MKNIFFLMFCFLMLITSAAFGQTTVSVDPAYAQSVLQTGITTIMPGATVGNDVTINESGASFSISGNVNLPGNTPMILTVDFTADDQSNKNAVLTGKLTDVTIEKLLQGIGANSTNLPSNFKTSVIKSLTMTINPADKTLTAGMTTSLGQMEIAGTKTKGYMIGIRPDNLGDMTGLGGINNALNGFTLIYSSHPSEENSSVKLLPNVKAQNGLNLYWTGNLPAPLVTFLELAPDPISGINDPVTFVCTQKLTEQLSAADLLPSLSYDLGGFEFSIVNFDKIKLELNLADASIGLAGDIISAFGGGFPELKFGSSLVVQVFSASLNGEIFYPGWNNAFGISGIDLTKLYLGTSVSLKSGEIYMGGSGEIFGLGSTLEVSNTAGQWGMKAIVDTPLKLEAGGFTFFSLTGMDPEKGPEFDLNSQLKGTFKGKINLLELGASEAELLVTTDTITYRQNANLLGGLNAALTVTATDFLDLKQANFELDAVINNNLRAKIVEKVEDALEDIDPLNFTGTVVNESLKAFEIKKIGFNTALRGFNKASVKIKVDATLGLIAVPVNVTVNLDVNPIDDIVTAVADAIVDELTKSGSMLWEGVEIAAGAVYLGGKEAINWSEGAANDSYEWMEGTVSAAGKWFEGAGESFVKFFGGGSSHSYDCSNDDFTPPSNGIKSIGFVPKGIDHYRITLQNIRTLTDGDGSYNYELWGSILIKTNMAMQQNANPFLYNNSCRTATNINNNPNPANSFPQHAKDFFISSDLISTANFDIEFVLFEEDPGRDDPFQIKTLHIEYRNGMGLPLDLGQKRFHSIILSVNETDSPQKIEVQVSIERILEPVNAPSVNIVNYGFGQSLNTNFNGIISFTASNDGSNLQRWEFVRRPDGYYNIKIKGETNNGYQFLSTNTTGKVFFDPRDNGSGWQQWELVKLADGKFNIKNKKFSPRFLSTNTTGKVFFDPADNGSGWQKWHLNPFEAKNSPLPQPEIIGIGTDNQLYTRATLNSNWVGVPNAWGFIGIVQLIDGTILGIGTDNQLWKRPTLTSPGEQVPNSGAVIAVTQLQDGAFLGVGKDYQLYTRATLNSNWVNVPNSGSVKAVTQLYNGTILGIGLDNQLYIRTTLNSNWVNVPNSGSVKGVTQLQDGTILGIGMNNQLYTRATLNSNWVNVPNSGSVIGVTSKRPPLRIGDRHSGGYIFYLARPGEDLDGDGIPDSGLVAAPSDQSSAIKWSDKTTTIPNLQKVAGSSPLSGQDLRIGDGATNTKAIVQDYNTSGGLAGKLCDELVLGGFNDWFLPSIGELNLMYNAIGNGAIGPNKNIGRFEGLYWSSTEQGSSGAWRLRFSNGEQWSNNKANTNNRVRAVRVF